MKGEGRGAHCTGSEAWESRYLQESEKNLEYLERMWGRECKGKEMRLERKGW